MTQNLTYTVGTLRAAGLMARWTKTRDGAPIIAVRYPKAANAHQRDRWWVVDRDMWAAMNERGILEAFDGHTLLGDIFSLPA